MNDTFTDYWTVFLHFFAGIGIYAVIVEITVMIRGHRRPRKDPANKK